MSTLNLIAWLQERRQSISNELGRMPAYLWGKPEFNCLADEELQVLAAQALFAQFANDQLVIEGAKEFALEAALRDVMFNLNNELMNRKADCMCDTFSTQFVDRARNQIGQLIDTVVSKSKVPA